MAAWRLEVLMDLTLKIDRTKMAASNRAQEMPEIFNSRLVFDFVE